MGLRDSGAYRGYILLGHVNSFHNWNNTELRDTMNKLHPTAGFLLHRIVSMGILDLKIQAMALSQCDVESMGYTHLVEGLNYSEKGLMATWPRRFNATQAKEYAHNSERIANHAYAGKIGNGDEASGDGWKYRGRGIIQLTGRDNYATCGKALAIDLLTEPSSLLNLDTAVCAAYWFLFQKAGDFEYYAKLGDVVECTKRVAGPNLTGLPARKDKYAEYLKFLTDERNEKDV